mgnify:CR=1 FL=1
MVICDEAAFMPEEVITQILLPMLSTTDGYAVLLSTPWGRDHFFYRAFMNPKYSVYKVKSSECPLIKPEFLEEMRGNMTREAYLREYEAEFAEALNSYFPQDLIRRCVEAAQRLGIELNTDLERRYPDGEYYAGLDLGKLQDHSVLAVLKMERGILELTYMKEHPIGTRYTEVIGHLRRAHQKFNFRRVYVDQTGVGEPILEEIRSQGVWCAEGVKFTTETKETLLSNLKLLMEQGRIAIPYNRRLCQQINEQRYEYTKTGHIRFSHPEKSHDDMLWALALAAAASRDREVKPKLGVIPK